MILSVSRRTDIPAFYSKWFINRIKEGFVYVRNPFNANQISKIPLTKDIVDCIVFWSKNPAPLLEDLPSIAREYDNNFYFQYTINGYDAEIEPRVPSLSNRIDTFKYISEHYGSNRVIWRYDPIFLSEKYTVNWHINTFRKIFNEIKLYTDTCVISFIDMYEKTANNTKPYSIHAPDLADMDCIAKGFSEIVQKSNITIRTCAESIDLGKYGIEYNSCIDKSRIEKLIGYELNAKPDKQRVNCQCVECADIGQYNTCNHGCKYCYANFSSKKVSASVLHHDDGSPLLVGSLSQNDIIKDYAKGISLKKRLAVYNTAGEQLCLF